MKTTLAAPTSPHHTNGSAPVESASIETVTPEIASSWLERSNSHNRDLQQSTVDTYASDQLDRPVASGLAPPHADRTVMNLRTGAGMGR